MNWWKADLAEMTVTPVEVTSVCDDGYIVIKCFDNEAEEASSTLVYRLGPIIRYYQERRAATAWLIRTLWKRYDEISSEITSFKEQILNLRNEQTELMTTINAIAED